LYTCSLEDISDCSCFFSLVGEDGSFLKLCILLLISVCSIVVVGLRYVGIVFVSLQYILDGLRYLSCTFASC
jgi:hypothetical protein